MYSVDVDCVSRETREALRHYSTMVSEWSKAINLISSGDRGKIWERHILDSLQVAGVPGVVADFGSGAGFPGIVIAICRRRKKLSPVFLVESDTRKCAFLDTVGRELDLDIKVLNDRIEGVRPLRCDTIISRAMGSVRYNAALAAPHMAPESSLVLMKGRKWKSEIEVAEMDWTFHVEDIQSSTDPEARILRLWNLRPRQSALTHDD